METIHIYHTNDIHSHFEQWPKIKNRLEKQKKLHKQAGEEVLLFDIGDFVDRWHPFSEATRGKGNVQLLNEGGYTAVTIGNNEGINLSYQELDDLYNKADFDVLIANLYKENKAVPEWAQPFRIYQTAKGTKIGVLGLTAPFTLLYQLLGWQLTDPVMELKKTLKILNENADIIILLSHLGIQADERIASEFPEIDLILGGHTHHVLEEGRKVNETLIGAAGKYGNYLGYIKLAVGDDKKVQDKTAKLYDINELQTTEMEQNQANALFEKGKDMLSQKIVVLPEPLISDFSKETKLSKLLCSALREWCDADCSFLTAGLLLGPLSSVVTNFDLLNICPHPINPCKVELTGTELENVLVQTRDPKWVDKQIIGLGFRGTVLGAFIYDGIEFLDDKVMINGAQIIRTKQYSVALPDMFTFGRFFPEIYQSKQRRYYLPEFLRDLLKWKLQKEY